MSRGRESLGGHYADNGGHKFRGDAFRDRNAFTEAFPGVPYFSAQQQQEAINQGLSKVQQHIIRRSMRRNPRSGR